MLKNMFTIGLCVILVIAARTCVVAKFFACDIPQNVMLRIPIKDTNVTINQAKMEVYLDDDSISFSHNRTNGTTDYRNFRVGRVKVVFRGYLETPGKNGNRIREDHRQVDTALQIVVDHYSGSISGAVAYNRTTLNSNVSQSGEFPFSEDCHFALLLTSKTRLGEKEAKLGLKGMHLDGIPSEVLQLAEFCVQRDICTIIRSAELTNANQTCLTRSKRALLPKFRFAPKEFLLRQILNQVWWKETRRAFRLPKIVWSKKTDLWLNKHHVREVVACRGKVILTTTFLDNLNCARSFLRKDNNYTFSMALMINELTVQYRRTQYMLDGKLQNGEFIDTLTGTVIKLGFTLHWNTKPVNVTLNRLEIWPGTNKIVGSSLDNATAEVLTKGIEGSTDAAFGEINKLTAQPECRLRVACYIATFFERFRSFFTP